MIFGEGPIIKNIAGDLNKLFLQGSRVNQPINNVEGDAAADQATVQLMADRDPVIRDISTGLGWAGREVTVSGTGALQLINSLGRPLKSWSVELAPYQEGSGDPSPENVRPIHGTNKLTIWNSGTNLLPTYTQTTTKDGVTFTSNADGSVTVNGTAERTTTFAASASTWKWDGVSDVWLSGCPIGGNYTSGYSLRIDVAGYSGRYSKADIGNGIKLEPYSTASGAEITEFPLLFDIIIRIGTVCNNLVFRPMLNLGLSALPYAQYIPPTQTVIDVPALGKNILNIEAGSHNAWSFVNIPNNLKPNTQYTLSLNGGTTYYYRLYLGNSQQSTRALTQAITGGESATFTTPSDMSTEPLLALAGSVSGAGNESLSNILPQVELGPSSTSYEPYANTVYYGTIGSDGGESRFGELDLVMSNWVFTQNRARTDYLNGIVKPPVSSSATIGSIAEQYKEVPGNTSLTAGTYAILQQEKIMLIFYYDGVNPPTGKLIYPLLNPQTFSLADFTIPTAEGDGTIWITAEDGIVTSFSATYLQSE